MFIIFYVRQNRVWECYGEFYAIEFYDTFYFGSSFFFIFLSGFTMVRWWFWVFRLIRGNDLNRTIEKKCQQIHNKWIIVIIGKLLCKYKWPHIIVHTFFLLYCFSLVHCIAFMLMRLWEVFIHFKTFLMWQLKNQNGPVTYSFRTFHIFYIYNKFLRLSIERICCLLDNIFFIVWVFIQVSAVNSNISWLFC